MRKITFLILLVAFIALCLCLASCKDDTNSNDPNTSYIIASDPVESYDNVSIYFPDNDRSDEEETVSTEGSEEEPSEINGFIIKEKKFDFGSNNVVLLNVENKTTQDYTLTVNGTYFDQNGNVLKTDIQSFEDFVAGYQGYFLFNPEIAFDTFSFTLSYNYFSGKPRLSNVKLLQWNKETAFFMVWQEQLIELAGIDDTIYNTLSTNYKFINENDVTLHIKRVMIAIDSNDEIISIKPFGYEKVAPREFGGGTFRLYHTLDPLTKDSQTWPKHLKGEIQLIMIPLDALTEEEYSELS